MTDEKVPAEAKTGLDLLRVKFPANMISKLPKPTKAQTEAVSKDYKAGIRCDVCGGWHHPKVVHLDYVGHAALTDRLLDCDPMWNWEPVAVTEDGTPKFDPLGGLWIRLTVCGVTRLGYGHADGKKGGDAIKEVIGDALRNAAMRFGAALDLWHKGELHPDEPAGDETTDKTDGLVNERQAAELRRLIEEAGIAPGAVLERGDCETIEEFPAEMFEAMCRKLKTTIKAKQSNGAAKPPETPPAPPPGQTYDDEIPF